MNVSQSVLLRRVDILGALGEGHTQAEVAEIIGVSVRTVQRVVALDRLRAAVPPDQLPDAIRAALAEEVNRRRRAMLIHDLAAVAVAEARTLRRSLRSGRTRRQAYAADEQDVRPLPVVDGSWPGLDDVEATKRAAAWALDFLRARSSP